MKLMMHTKASILFFTLRLLLTYESKKVRHRLQNATENMRNRHRERDVISSAKGETRELHVLTSTRSHSSTKLHSRSFSSIRLILPGFSGWPLKRTSATYNFWLTNPDDPITVNLLVKKIPVLFHFCIVHKRNSEKYLIHVPYTRMYM